MAAVTINNLSPDVYSFVPLLTYQVQIDNVSGLSLAYMRGWDTGSGVFVYWQTRNPAAIPATTSPAATGAVVNAQIVG